MAAWGIIMPSIEDVEMGDGGSAGDREASDRDLFGRGYRSRSPAPGTATVIMAASWRFWRFIVAVSGRIEMLGMTMRGAGSIPPRLGELEGPGTTGSLACRFGETDSRLDELTDVLDSPRSPDP